MRAEKKSRWRADVATPFGPSTRCRRESSLYAAWQSPLEQNKRSLLSISREDFPALAN